MNKEGHHRFILVTILLTAFLTATAVCIVPPEYFFKTLLVFAIGTPIIIVVCHGKPYTVEKQ